MQGSQAINHARAPLDWPVSYPLGFQMAVPAHPVSIGFVRRSVVALADVLPKATAELLGLVMTELVTNVIRHASVPPDGTLDVKVEVRESRVFGSVRDSGIGFSPDPAGPRPNGEGGFGLVIVERVARRWGVELSAEGTEVWFEL